MNDFAMFIGWIAALAAASIGLSISAFSMWILFSGQSGDGLVTVNAVLGVAFLVCGFVIAKRVEARANSKEDLS